jgi:hypothetical protein
MDYLISSSATPVDAKAAALIIAFLYSLSHSDSDVNPSQWESFRANINNK